MLRKLLLAMYQYSRYRSVTRRPGSQLYRASPFIGHGAIVHGAIVGDSSLIGMRATVLNKQNRKRLIIGAHALVTEKWKFLIILWLSGRQLGCR